MFDSFKSSWFLVTNRQMRHSAVQYYSTQPKLTEIDKSHILNIWCHNFIDEFFTKMSTSSEEENLQRQQEEIEALNAIYDENIILGKVLTKTFVRL